MVLYVSSLRRVETGRRRSSLLLSMLVAGLKGSSVESHEIVVYNRYEFSKAASEYLRQTEHKFTTLNNDEHHDLTV